ncbi:hypothetical protein [Caulobacter mirabilis]|uniref:Uncharacterized protein n=1 Tax=Caulobacter mirabilis TaxID=69666 RepID=A0A2D2ASU2_9CAUL|nr:hypothetical protein [Caulobacter mirabilis]ATQ41074.1 hypothetical protein CSW64_00950 [Caulobacter mirabilis]
MDRRVFVFSALALSGCGLSGGPVTVVCDPDLTSNLARALAARDAKAYRLEGLSPKGLLERAEAGGGLILVTAEPKLTDRLQRLGFARLQNRWKLQVRGAPAHMIVTDGAGEAAAVHLAKWLAGEEAAPLLSAP